MRAWDGLVVLVRVSADGERDASHVFRGYVVGGRTLVGAWRPLLANTHSVPLEGMFVVSRMAPHRRCCCPLLHRCCCRCRRR